LEPFVTLGEKNVFSC